MNDLQPDDKLPKQPQQTSKQERVNFEETDTFSQPGGPKQPPPAGSLAAWLAKKQSAVGGSPTPRSRRSRGTAGADANADQWWICCDPLAPIPLGDKISTLTIGRSPHADVVLPHTQVSRVHGKIKVLAAGNYVYEDNGSSNGSVLNGEKTESAQLQVGDVLSLGPYEIVIHSAETLKNRSTTESQEFAEGNHTRVVTPKPQAAMSGRLNEVPIAEILQGLEFNRKTGTLEIKSKAGRGRLIVCEGHPIQASFQDAYHDEALVLLAGLREGNFEFSASVEPGEPMFRSTITALLLEATRREDEQR